MTGLTQEEIRVLLGGPTEEPKQEDNEMTLVDVLPMEAIEQILGMIGGDKPPSQPQFKFETQEQENVIERLDKSIMKTLQLMHDRLARRFVVKISKMLQSVVDVRLVSVDQLCYSEFVFGCDNPSCFNLIEVELLTIIKDLSYGKVNMTLDISPAIVPPMIERMLGGGREPSMTVRRPLTNIEWKLAQRIIDEFLCELHIAWKDVADMKCTVAQQESNPQMVAVIKTNEPVVVICFEVSLIEQRGHVSLCIPVDLVEVLMKQCRLAA